MDSLKLLVVREVGRNFAIICTSEEEGKAIHKRLSQAVIISTMMIPLQSGIILYTKTDGTLLWNLDARVEVGNEDF